MSRCFPFPPPGYDKKARIDDTNLLTKESQKEKKHKKDKKDKERKDKKEKEKKDKKEKNDKDRSKEKHKEKKDRKEKHKDKDKDKSQISDERRADKQTPVRNEEKFSTNSMQRNENNDSKYVQELARRIKDEDKISGSEMLQRNLALDQRGAGLFGKPVLDEEKFSSTSLQRNENNNSKHVLELARRNKDEDRISGSEMLQRNLASDQRAEGLFGKPVQDSIGRQSVENDGFRFKNEDRKKITEQRNHITDRGLGKEFGEILHRDKERAEGIPIPMEKTPDKQVERKEKTKSKDSSFKGEKRKNRDQEKDRKSRDKDQNKEKKKEKTKEITELSKEQPKIRESGQKLKENSKGSFDSQHTNSLASSKSSSPGSSSQGNLGKRKEFEMNGYMLDNGIRPSKFPRVFPSAPTVENGRKLKSSQTPIRFASEEPGPASNSESDTTDCKINGSKVAQQSDPPPSLPMPVPSKPLVNQNGEASAKPPHPDTKYLSQILSVPTVEDLPDVDDQEWLFRSNLRLNKSDKSSPGVDEMQVDETQHVWSEARWIESADISALPYVIPY